MNCKNCNQVVPDNARFCSHCGQPLSGDPVTAEQNPGGFNLDRYLPRELAAKFESMRANKSMSGERRIISMLFCDVKGSTAAAEQLDPEEWTEIINGAFERMIQPIYKYEGLVPRLMGDAILAFFGAPIAHEDDPQRAVLAGLEIQSGVRPYAEEMQTRYGVNFGLRVGINTGLVVVGEIGSDLRMEYTAIGDAINLAARMEQTAAPGSVQISGETYKLVAPFFEFESLGGIEVKGKAAPVNAYRVISVKEVPEKARGLKGFSSPLVGREAELSTLEESLSALESGKGAIVSILGEAGLGKSSLVNAFHQRAGSTAVTWFEAHALSYTQSISYFSWRQVIRQAIGARENDISSEVRGKLRYSCDCCALPGGDIPFLEAMLAVESEESLQEVTGFQGDAFLRRMMDATRGYLCALTRESPLIITFDDLHWMDEASLTLLSGIFDLVETHPVLFICMMRPERDSQSWEFSQRLRRDLANSSRQIELSPFSREKTNDLLVSLLGPRALPDSLRDRILEKAEGNPFFVEEIIRSLMETGQIIRDEEGWRTAEKTARLSLPNTLSGVLSARIDRLPDPTKQVLHFASVIGRSFDLQILSAIAVQPQELRTHIDMLEHAGLVQAVLDGTDAEFMFRHVLIQEAAYTSILLKHRRELHARVGEIMEGMYSDRLNEFAPLLAHHFYTAQDPRSLQYDILAGESAARLFANTEAATHFRRALEVGRRNGAELKQIRYLFSELGRVLELAGNYDQALENYNALQEFGRKRADRSIEMAALMAKAPLYSIFTPLHDSALSEKLLLEALKISQEIEDRTAQARLNWNLMLNYLFSKRTDQALEHGQLALSLARQSDNREQLAYVLNDLCRLYTCRGEFDKAYFVIHEARELWRLLDNQVMLADSLGSEAEALFNAGKFDQSFERSQQALQITENIENLWGQSYDRMLMSFVLFEKGEIGPGIRLAEQSIQLADGAGLIASGIGLRAELAWVYAYCGALDKGLNIIDQALQVAEAKQPAWKTFPQAGKIRMYLLHDDVHSARQVAGDKLLQPISIPYARYTIFLCLANIELAVSKGDNELALELAENLLKETSSLTRVDVPDVLRWKGLALSGAGRFDEAQQVLAQARALAEESGSNIHLWLILQSLADVNAELGNNKEAESNRASARKIVEQIAESLREVGLRDSFLNQPRVQALTR